MAGDAFIRGNPSNRRALMGRLNSVYQTSRPRNLDFDAEGWNNAGP